MTHARTQIRNAVITAVTGLATTGSRVFEGRIYPLATDELPALCVYTLNESSERISTTSLQRDLELVVEAYVHTSVRYDELLDSIATEVETAIAANAALQALVKDITPVQFQKDLMKEGDKTIAVAILTFRCIYITHPSNPETIK
jgi:hypothetical protein